jgi:hypothetical protein
MKYVKVLTDMVKIIIFWTLDCFLFSPESSLVGKAGLIICSEMAKIVLTAHELVTQPIRYTLNISSQ